jgi:RimJ/RimL family protein N-acetyltransferase
MSPRLNELGQPIGEAVPDWSPRPRPPRTPMEGRWARIETLDAGRHGADLWDAVSADRENRNWTYLTTGPFAREEDYGAWLELAAKSEDPFFHAIIDKASGKAVGVASYLRIDPPHGVIEVGHINFSPLLQRTPVATDSMYLMMRRVFDELGYRRYEWKCDSLNAASRAAAERLGFQYEGLFRQAIVYRGRSRDTAWFAIIDKDWPALKARFERWLDPKNFDRAGRQKKRLAELT